MVIAAFKKLRTRFFALMAVAFVALTLLGALAQSLWVVIIGTLVVGLCLVLGLTAMVMAADEF